VPSKGKSTKRALTFLAQNDDSRMLNYVNVDINRKDAPDKY